MFKFLFVLRSLEYAFLHSCLESPSLLTMCPNCKNKNQKNTKNKPNKPNKPKTTKQTNNKMVTAITMKKVAQTGKVLDSVFKFYNEFLTLLIQEDESWNFVITDKTTAWVVTLLHGKAVVRKSHYLLSMLHCVIMVIAQIRPG